MPTQTSVVRVSLSSSATPAIRSGHYLVIRARVTGGTGTMRAALYEAGANRSGDLESLPLQTFLKTFVLPIATANAAAITSYANLEFRFWGYSLVGDAVQFEVADISVRLPWVIVAPGIASVNAFGTPQRTAPLLAVNTISMGLPDPGFQVGTGFQSGAFQGPVIAIVSAAAFGVPELYTVAAIYPSASLWPGDAPIGLTPVGIAEPGPAFQLSGYYDQAFQDLGEKFGRPTLTQTAPGVWQVTPVGVAPSEAFGRPSLFGGVPPVLNVGQPGGVDLRDDEVFTCWPGDDSLYDVACSSDDAPVYSVDVSTD